MIKIECRLIAIFSFIAIFSELIVLLYQPSNVLFCFLFYPESNPLVSFYALLNAYFTRFDSPQLLFQSMNLRIISSQSVYLYQIFFISFLNAII